MEVLFVRFLRTVFMINNEKKTHCWFSGDSFNFNQTAHDLCVLSAEQQRQLDIFKTVGNPKVVPTRSALTRRERRPECCRHPAKNLAVPFMHFFSFCLRFSHHHHPCSHWRHRHHHSRWAHTTTYYYIGARRAAAASDRGARANDSPVDRVGTPPYRTHTRSTRTDSTCPQSLAACRRRAPAVCSPLSSSIQFFPWPSSGKIVVSFKNR